MYYRSGTAEMLLHRGRKTIRVHTLGGNTFLCEVYYEVNTHNRTQIDWPPSYTCDVISEIPLHIYSKNNPTKFHHAPLRNE